MLTKTLGCITLTVKSLHHKWEGGDDDVQMMTVISFVWAGEVGAQNFESHSQKESPIPKRNHELSIQGLPLQVNWVLI